jgi:hypothetical protein
MANLYRPIPESYWVEPGHLLAGEYPGHSTEERTRKRLDALIETGFDLFIDLTQPDELFPYTGILHEEAELYGVDVFYHRFPIGDFGLPSLRQMDLILNEIENGVQTGHKIYLHCWGGVGRTGTTVGCYLVRQGRTGKEALNQLSIWWNEVPKSRYHRYSPETPEQMDFILRWSEHDPRKT